LLGWFTLLACACIASEAYNTCLSHFKASLSLHQGFCPKPNLIQQAQLVLLEKANHLLLGKAIQITVINPVCFQLLIGGAFVATWVISLVVIIVMCGLIIAYVHAMLIQVSLRNSPLLRLAEGLVMPTNMRSGRTTPIRETPTRYRLQQDRQDIFNPPMAQELRFEGPASSGSQRTQASNELKVIPQSMNYNYQEPMNLFQ